MNAISRLVSPPVTRDLFGLRPRRRAVPRSYLAAVAAGVAGLIVLPYARRLLRREPGPGRSTGPVAAAETAPTFSGPVEALSG